MKKWERLIAAAVVLALAAFTIYVVGVAYWLSSREKPVVVPYGVAQQRIGTETTFATKNDIETRIQPITLEEIVSETRDFSQIEINTNENRRNFCVGLLKEAGYDPVMTDSGDVLAVKQGQMLDYVAVGAHYDKVNRPSEGILDNMVGCILVSDIAEALKDQPTNYTYLFLTYGDEEMGRKIGSATSGYRSGHDQRPAYVVEIDYVGDNGAELGGRWLSPNGGRFLKIGIKITTYPMPDPASIHTERDNIINVDFGKAYLAYKTAISLIEGIEKEDGLVPPETVNFWRKDRPLFGH